MSAHMRLIARSPHQQTASGLGQPLTLEPDRHVWHFYASGRFLGTVSGCVRAEVRALFPKARIYAIGGAVDIWEHW